MTIEFGILEAAATSGDLAARLPALRARLREAAIDMLLARLPMLRGRMRDAGEGVRARLPPLRGWASATPTALHGRLPALRGTASEGLAVSLAVAIAGLPALWATLQGVTHTVGAVEASLPPLRALASDALDLAHGRLAPLRGFALDVVPVPQNYLLLLQNPGTFYADAGILRETLAEPLELHDGALAALIVRVMQALAAGDALHSHGELAAAFAEVLALAEAFAFAWHEDLAEALATADTVVVTSLALHVLAEALALQETAAGGLDAQVVVALAAFVHEVAASGAWDSILDAATLADTLGPVVHALLGLGESLALADAAMPAVTFLVVADEALVLGGSLASALDALQRAGESLHLTARLRLGDTEYLAWVVNTATRAVSTYANYPFNAFAKIGDAWFGSADDGIYVLDGDDDAGTPIPAEIRTGLTHLGTGKLKRLPTAYIGYRTDGEVVLKVVVTGEDGEKDEHWYRLEARPAPTTRATHVKLGRGLKSVYWQFALANVDGADLALDELALVPMLLDRRLP